MARRALVEAVVPTARPARLAWEQVRGPNLAERLHADVWHGPHYTMPARLRIPAVVTVHDLTFFDHPEWHERAKVLYFRRAIVESARRAAVIVCVSDTTAARLDVVAPARGTVMVINHGVDTDRFRPDAADEQDDRVRLAALGIDSPYLAFIGTIEPRKNLPALISAFSRVAPDHPDLRLVLAGRPGWGRRGRRLGRRERRRRAHRASGLSPRRCPAGLPPPRRRGHVPVTRGGIRDPAARGDGLGDTGAHQRRCGDRRPRR